MEVFLARQPIFNRAQQVVAYEVLYRGREENLAQFEDADEATSEVFLNTFMEIGLDRVTGQHRAFLNLTRPFLMGEKPLPFSHENVTLEVLEDIVPDDELIAAVKRLAEQGYEIALDDFIFRKELVPLIELADIIKIDIRQLTPEQLEKHVRLLKNFDVRLLAEKVETREEFADCYDLGFHLFQGYFFCEPAILRAKQANPSRLASLQLLQKINNPQFSFDELTEVISTDATLAYKLLRYINSAYFGLRREIESIHHALVMLGQKNIRMWLNLIALSKAQDKNHELMVMTLTRAKMAELLAVDLRRGDGKDSYFLAGLFSSISALVDMPLEEVLEEITLADEIKEGLLGKGGPITDVLQVVYHTERGDWANMNRLGLSVVQINRAYIEGIDWAGGVLQLLSE